MQPFYVDGEWVETNNRFESRNPATGGLIDVFSEATEADVETAVSAADEAFDEWAGLSRIDRASYLWDVHDQLTDSVEELGAVVSTECGKEIGEGKADITEAAHMVEWAAGDARHPSGDVVPSEIPEKDAYMRRRPRGVTACITPWNFPVAIPFWHMATALVEGNTVVFKPAEQTPHCGHRIAQMFDTAGIPDGVFNLIQGTGETVGSHLTAQDAVRTILFTGSSDVGQQIQRRAAQRPQTRAACEMGGKNAIVVTEQADIELAVKIAIVSCFKTTGQRCVSTERLIVHRDVLDEFTTQFTNTAQTVSVGRPLDESTFMGPMVSQSQADRVAEFNQQARETDGLETLVDRQTLSDEEIPDGTPDGHWVGPFVYESDPYDPDEPLLKQEVFGPHAAIIPYEGDIGRAIDIHNDTPYGLTGCIISENYRQLNQFRDTAEVGFAYANAPCIGAEVQLPFGGVKQSGSGYPSARAVIEAVTDRTAWTVNNADEFELAQGLSGEITTTDEDS